MKLRLEEEQVETYAIQMLERYRGNFCDLRTVYGIPRGGIPVAYELVRACHKYNIVSDITYDPSQATIIVDDIIDSGNTMTKYKSRYPEKQFDALIPDKTMLRLQKTDWVIFPWERFDEALNGPTENVKRLLQHIGEDTERNGLLETPERFVKYFEEITEGYRESPYEHLKLFEDDPNSYDQMVIVKDIPFYSLCEHHLAPFFGTATIGYIPGQKIIGLSKLARIVDTFAKRLQVQERLTHDIGRFLEEGLQDAVGIGIMVKARHLCMESRGIRKQGHYTTTNALFGAIREDGTARNEFLSVARSI